ncbi:MAG: hypothetical protein QW279_04570, partial [Candidatus Jordarchaeaceae archaeon]
FWHFDLIQGSEIFYDAFCMAPYAVVHLIIFCVLLFFSLYFSQFSIYHILLIFFYFPFIQLVNYPHLTMRDVYLHAGPAKMVIVNGGLSSPSTSTYWPASFDLHGILSIISGCDLVISNYVLYLLLIVLLSALLYCFVRTVKDAGYQLAWISALLFPSLFLNFNFSSFNHYSRNALAFFFLFLFLFSYYRFNGRRGLLFHLLLIFCIIITHPFHSLALVAFLSIFALLNRRINLCVYALFSAVCFIAWFYFSGFNAFVQAVEQAKIMLTHEYLKPIVETLATTQRLPWWGTLLREYFKYSFIALFALSIMTALLLMFIKKMQDKTSLVFSSILFSSVLMLFSLNLLPDWQISRFVMFGAFPVAFSSFILIEAMLKNKKERIPYKRFNLSAKKFVLLFFVLSLFTTVTVSNFEKNYYFGELCHPIELSALTFFFTYNQNLSVNVVSWRTNMYCAYFNFNLSHNTLMLWYLELGEIGNNATQLLLRQGMLINQSEAVIRGMRDEFVFFRVDDPKTVLSIIDDKFIKLDFNQVYCNDRYKIYTRYVNCGEK